MTSVTHASVGFPLRSSSVRVERPVRAPLRRSLGLPRASLFFGLARRQDPLQTNCHGRPLGRLATRPHDSLRDPVLDGASPVAYPASLFPARVRWLHGLNS